MARHIASGVACCALSLVLVGCGAVQRLAGFASCDDLLFAEQRAVLFEPADDAELRSRIATLAQIDVEQVRRGNDDDPAAAQYVWSTWDADYRLNLEGGVPAALIVYQKVGRPSIRQWIACAGEPGRYGAHLGSGVPEQGPDLAVELYHAGSGAVATYRGLSPLDYAAQTEWAYLDDNLLNYPLATFSFSNPTSVDELVRQHLSSLRLEAPDATWNAWIPTRVALLRPWPQAGEGYQYNRAEEWVPPFKY